MKLLSLQAARETKHKHIWIHKLILLSTSFKRPYLEPKQANKILGKLF